MKLELTKEKITEIKTDAAENWEGDLSLAVAAQLHGAGVVMRSGRRIPLFANKSYIGKLVKQIEGAKVSTPKTKKEKADKKDESPE